MIEVVEGNLLDSPCNIICHQCNAKGIMASGIAHQIKNKWPKVYSDYKTIINTMYINDIISCSSDLLGMITWTKIDCNMKKYVINFFSQNNYKPRNVCHTYYRAFRDCCRNLKKFIAKRFHKQDCIIGFPYKIGCGVAGGDWATIYKIIYEELNDYNVKIYMLNGQVKRTLKDQV